MTQLLADAANEIDESIVVEPGGTLFVDLDRGGVEITSHDVDEVRIEARASGWGAWHFEFDLARRENDVRLSGEMARWALWFMGPRVRVRAWVPRAYSVDVRTGGGSIRLDNISGRILAETSGGSVDLQGAEGAVTLHTSGGSIRVAHVEGDVRVDTSGGCIDIAQVIGDALANTSGGSIKIARVTGRIAARTSGGQIDVREAGELVDATTSGGSIFTSFVAAPAGSLETSGGNIDVRFPPTAGAALDAETRGGRVDIQPPLTVEGVTEPRHVVAQINGGGTPLRLRTSGGNIRVGSL